MCGLAVTLETFSKCWLWRFAHALMLFAPKVHNEGRFNVLAQAAPVKWWRLTNNQAFIAILIHAKCRSLFTSFIKRWRYCWKRVLYIVKTTLLFSLYKISIFSVSRPWILEPLSVRDTKEAANRLHANGFRSAVLGILGTYSTNATLWWLKALKILLSEAYLRTWCSGFLHFYLEKEWSCKRNKSTEGLWSVLSTWLSQGNENSLQNKRRNKRTLAEIKTMGCFHPKLYIWSNSP